MGPAAVELPDEAAPGFAAVMSALLPVHHATTPRKVITTCSLSNMQTQKHIAAHSEEEIKQAEEAGELKESQAQINMSNLFTFTLSAELASRYRNRNACFC